MRIVIAPDSFKGCLEAPRVAEAIRRGVAAVLAGADVALVPMADGGEGTAEVLRAAVGGRWVDVEATGPRAGARVASGYVRLQSGAVAVVEMARASGLALLGEEWLDPLATTTYGTGELLAAAFSDLPESVWLTAGGSATVDGGTGAARALGWRFLDAAGDSIPLGGGGLVRLARIVPPETTAGLPDVTLLADVTNPLVGAEGAARVFAPQKGADERCVAVLEQGLENLAERIREDLGIDVSDLPGGGAAGGLGAGAVAFLDAEIAPGVDLVMDATGLGHAVDGADWVITGEGRFDAQSLGGKVVSGVARLARERGAKVAVVAGRSTLLPDQITRAGVDVVVEATPPEMAVPEGMFQAEELVESAAGRLAREHLA